MSKKQNITITGKAANDRIARAIPVFENRFSMSRDQATAVAIRLESVGRLKGVGLIATSQKPKGAGRIAAAALAASLIPKRTKVRDKPISTTTVEGLRSALEMKPSKAAQKRLVKRSRRRNRKK